MRWSYAFLIAWAALIGYSFILAPPYDPDTMDMVADMSTGNLGGQNPVVVSLFYLMGVWPFAFAAVILPDGKGKKLPAWPFVIGSFFAGAFAVLPYMGLRKENRRFIGEMGPVLKVTESKIFALVLKVSAIGLIVYAVGLGDWSDFFDLFRSSMFIHVMTLDFLALTIAFPFMMKADMQKRGWGKKGSFWCMALVPILGPMTYLLLRPPLESERQD